MEIDEIIEAALVGLYRGDFFNKKLYLKGGQALRIKEGLKNRFSADMDFSTPGKILNTDHFFGNLANSLSAEFSTRGLHFFDLNFERKPKFRDAGTPDFWTGWEITFKLIENDKIHLGIEQKRREAIVPRGTNSSKIKLDISEYEYCDSVERVKVASTTISVYSRTSLVLEKIRAICKQHPDYPLKNEVARSRDYYDIERLWDKVLKEGNTNAFLADCRKHLPGIFKAKEVPVELMKKIFDEDFLKLQKDGWRSVVSTVSQKVQDFDYYVETLRLVLNKINTKN